MSLMHLHIFQSSSPMLPVPFFNQLTISEVYQDHSLGSLRLGYVSCAPLKIAETPVKALKVEVRELQVPLLL